MTKADELNALAAELKPCPFCGGKNVTLRCEMTPPPESRPWYWAVWCECGARCRAEADIYSDGMARAARVWNTRAALSQTDGEEEGTGSPSAPHPSREQGGLV